MAIEDPDITGDQKVRDERPDDVIESGVSSITGTHGPCVILQNALSAHTPWASFAIAARANMLNVPRREKLSIFAFYGFEVSIYGVT
jgi:hypothetical protein